ncbi:hypothetical protein D5086_018636 [Populus alba]|uniref:Uncharacterized protein n=1 Tax=Populus alba TaxID=43335 RepID=A0ACC4BRH7_POPAL
MDDLPSSCSYGFLDELLKDTPHACTHTHTCNPPGPDNPHTHVCFHAHTKLLSSSEDKVESEDTAESIEKKSKKRPLGNREAVRKCDDQVYCQHPGLDGKGGEGEALKGQGFNSCEFENLQCMEYQNSGMRDLPGCSIGNEEMNGNSSSANKRKGGACEATVLGYSAEAA